MNVELGICLIAAPISSVFAVQPWGSAVISTCIAELIVDGLVANVAIGIVLLFCSSSLAKDVPVPIARGTDSVSLRVSCATSS